jgi:hypothetical protein
MICSGRDKIETPEQVCLFMYICLQNIFLLCFLFSNSYFVIICQLRLLFFQFKQTEDTANKLDLDGLVVIGGDDSNTNACLLGEYFRSAANTLVYFGFISVLCLIWCFKIIVRLTNLLQW